MSFRLLRRSSHTGVSDAADALETSGGDIQAGGRHTATLASMPIYRSKAPKYRVVEGLILLVGSMSSVDTLDWGTLTLRVYDMLG